jgi:hypothetical protein
MNNYPEIPITDDERLGIWKWVKENCIDRGMTIDKIGNAINQRFFAGQARPEWIEDIVSGRKTPFESAVKEAWRAHYNRRMVELEARNWIAREELAQEAKAKGWRPEAKGWRRWFQMKRTRS